MIVDSSALMAIVFAEAGHERLVDALIAANGAAIGAPTITELGILLAARLGPKSPGLVERLLQEFKIEVVPFDEPHARAAVDAFRRYGKGRHPAGLNFGDCMAYAVAKLAEVPLLYVGDDFARTDIGAAAPTGDSKRRHS